ncbi:unnamed protein product [Rhizophagus irregularis]|uniref:Glycoside hydrolase/deacetylase n=1 Tax=Rhizophagus irregularis TaxID=588596 RepID=A0A2I1GPB9_9GLOM|nr:glycoside hydrolase/deacetylase [Rhizophagus irregularis]CAB4410153.1 unnamed protein product [Rhizophagus irregularis]
MKIKFLTVALTILVCSSELIFGQTADGKCGATGGNQNCGTQFCCSQFGFCGNTVDHCGTGCQPSFGKCGTGTAPPANSTTPTNPGTSTPAVEITTCSKSGTVAITFDDGPSQFTSTLLDKLKVDNFKATFFINGNNGGCIYDNAEVVKRAFNEGHQIASHTWSHQDLATLNKDQIKYQMKKLEEALVKILGVKPVYMRPPFGSGVDKPLVMSTLGELGYKVVTWDIDTNDWQGRSTSECLNEYRNASPPPKPHIALNHDTIKNTATNMAPQAFKIMKSRGFKINTVGECLGVTDPTKWYIKVGAPQTRDNTWVCKDSDITGP